ncbi:MAG TPA: division/cell wall cluster transcriptional repressor MraZ [Candidatus Udaeobacter sp.]|jgi:MraZ protein|nr:division/cell wall cluster transcriptional repressor MraZ [Candidatus Udaeobacter sp.]
MASFYGTETYAIDHKGRLSVPASMRRQGAGRRSHQTFTLIAGFEGCLALYSQDDWQRVEDRLRRIPMGDRRGRAFARAFLMNACKVTVDAQGRVTIPPALLHRAGLDREAVLHGQVDRIEIWHPDRLKEAMSETDGRLETLADEVLGRE